MPSTRLALIAGLAIALPGSSVNAMQPMGASEAAVDADASPSLSESERLELLRSVMPSLVKVRVYVKYDKGQLPEAAGSWTRDWEELIREERPAEAMGIVVSPTEVWTSDLPADPRFIDRIEVVDGEQVVRATRGRVSDRFWTMRLDLTEPLQDAEPIEFRADVPETLFAVRYTPWEGQWIAGIASTRSDVALFDDDSGVRRFPSGPLVVDDEGRGVAFSSVDRVPLGVEWVGAPGSFDGVAFDKIRKTVEQIAAGSDAVVPRVSLRFRSPRKSDTQDMYTGYGNDDTGITQWDGPGVMLPGGRVLVLASLDPKTTARLERITVHDGSGEDGRPASFIGTLKDYGGFIADVESASDVTPPLALDEQIYDLRDRLVASVLVRIQDDDREVTATHSRIGSFREGRRSMRFPDEVSPVAMSSSGYGYGYYGYGGGASERMRFLFSMDGDLLAIPISERRPVTIEERWDSDSPVMTPVHHLARIIEDDTDAFDENNIPLSEEEANRLAWLGVELQAMDPDLARINGVLDQTSGGTTGAIVTYIYPDSPAQEIGLDLGDVLLRITAEGQPRPFEIALEGDFWGFGEFDFWGQLDMIPAEMFGNIPAPWPNAENTLNSTLTDIGFGTPYVLEYVSGDELKSADLMVEQGPGHYAAATRHKDDDLGMTVRDMTFEVRRYFQKKPDEAGVIVSAIESGEPAAIGGLKPYEIIERVGETDIHTVDEFEQAVAEAEGELSLTVTRFNKTRVVKIRPN